MPIIVLKAHLNEFDEDKLIGIVCGIGSLLNVLGSCFPWRTRLLSLASRARQAPGGAVQPTIRTTATMSRKLPRARPTSGQNPVKRNMVGKGTISVNWQMKVDEDIDKDSWEWETGDVEKRRQYLVKENVLPLTLEDW